MTDDDTAAPPPYQAVGASSSRAIVEPLNDAAPPPIYEAAAAAPGAPASSRSSPPAPSAASRACPHWAMRGCKMTSGPQRCCMCLDQRPHTADERYPVYIDGLRGQTGTAPRWAHYCAPCQRAQAGRRGSRIAAAADNYKAWLPSARPAASAAAAPQEQQQQQTQQQSGRRRGPRDPDWVSAEEEERRADQLWMEDQARRLAGSQVALQALGDERDRVRAVEKAQREELAATRKRLQQLNAEYRAQAMLLDEEMEAASALRRARQRWEAATGARYTGQLRKEEEEGTGSSEVVGEKAKLRMEEKAEKTAETAEAPVWEEPPARPMVEMNTGRSSGSGSGSRGWIGRVLGRSRES